MSTKTQFFCDLCGKEIHAKAWDTMPMKVSIIIGRPHPWEVHLEHTCYHCAESIRGAIAVRQQKVVTG